MCATASAVNRTWTGSPLGRALLPPPTALPENLALSPGSTLVSLPGRRLRSPYRLLLLALSTHSAIPISAALPVVWNAHVVEQGMYTLGLRGKQGNAHVVGLTSRELHTLLGQQAGKSFAGLSKLHLVCV